MGRGVKVVVALVCALVLAGCGSGGGDPSNGNSRSSSADGSQAAAAGGVDPQVLQDAIEFAFPVPGRRILRTMRVDTFTTGWAIEQCGGTAGPLDSTADRLEQDTYPDLDLIRKKGFLEPDTQTWKGARPGCDGASKGNLNDRMPTFQEVMTKPKSTWEDDVILSTLQDPGLVALKKPFAQCLRNDSYVQQLGMKVSDDDPPTSFILQTDLADKKMRGSSPDFHRLARLYADCGKDYFAKLTKLLLAQRPAQVERNRELLEKFARQLSGLGYVP